MDHHDFDNIKRETETYWQQQKEHARAFYLGPPKEPKPLFWREMDAVEQRGLLPEQSGRPTTLALLVGDSFDPLLQSIWLYKPDKLVPIVNSYYGDRETTRHNHKHGREQWKKLRKEICSLTQDWNPPLLLPDPQNLQTITLNEDGTDAPTRVFERLHQLLAEDLTKDRRVIVDITGAKKTMVAGAFLFAAYTNAEIAYIDFDSYEPNAGRPYGFTCRPIIVENPLRRLALREWDNIARLYTQHDFAGALALLPVDLPPELQLWKTEIDDLHCFLQICAYWDNRQLRQAKEDLTELPAGLRALIPLVVETLGDYWPARDQKREEWVSKSFLLNPRCLVVYAEDELARCRRLLAENNKSRQDYRAAFTRAYALYETLLKARVLALFERGEILVRLGKNGKKLPAARLEEPWRVAVVRWLSDRMLSKTTLSLIIVQANDKDVPGRKLTREDTGQQLPATLWRITNQASPHYEPEEFLKASPADYAEQAQELTYTRNVITHNYVPVADNVVRQVIRLAEANLKDYQVRWGKYADTTFDPEEKFEPGQFDVPDWATLKQACELDFIPDSREHANMEDVQ